MRCADPALDAGPTADASTMTFRFADPGHRLAGVRLHHNYTAWRDAFDPHLTGLLQQLRR